VPIFFTVPNLTCLLGPGNTYDGSTHYIDTIGATVVDIYEPYSFTKTNLYLKYGFELGYHILSNKVQVPISVGIERRVWKRNLIDRSDIPSGVRARIYERYSWFAVMLNSKVAVHPTDRFAFGIHLTGKYLFCGRMHNKGKIRDEYNSVEIDADIVKLWEGEAHDEKQMKRLGLYAAIPFEFRFSRKVGLRLMPYFEFYQFGKSDIGYMQWKGDVEYNDPVPFFEPASKTGLSLDVLISPKVNKSTNRPKEKSSTGYHRK